MRSIYFVLVMAVGLLLPSAHAVAGTDFLLSANVGFNETDYEDIGEEYTVDVDKVAVSSRFYPTDQYYLAGTYSSGNGKVEQLEFDMTEMSVGVGIVMLNRVNYRSGAGHELRLGLSYVEAERDYKLGSTEEAWTDVNIGYTAGLDYGFSGFAEYKANIEHFDDNAYFLIGVTKHIAAGLLVRAGFEARVIDLEDNASSTMSGFHMGAGYAF